MWKPLVRLAAAPILLCACSSEAQDGAGPGPSSELPGARGVVGGSADATEPVGELPSRRREPIADCGGATGRTCADGMACKDATDCASRVCAAGVCQAPRATDGVKNGDETDVDCGGSSGVACPAGKACVGHHDCASEACAYDARCAEAPSCTPHFGGDTCGSGEVGSGEEQHESCCRSLPVPGFGDASRPGKIVWLDKYEVTAGRVRAFLDRLKEQYGRPDVKRWITEHRPTNWVDGWTPYLPSDTEAEQTDKGNVGTSYAFGSALYVYVHGHNCFQGADSYGYPTFWYPADVMQNQNGGLPRVATKEQLDVKAMTCIPNAVLAAFCAWDGGQLATTDVLSFVTANGARLPPRAVSNVSADSGAVSGVYYFPSFGPAVTHEGVSRIAAPGRMTGDALVIGAGEAWMDLRGNLNEVARAGNAFALLYEGIGYLSARALENPGTIPLSYYKAAYSGGRCMRFR